MRNIHVSADTYMYVTTIISEKIGQTFEEKEQGEVHGRVWR